MSEERSRLRAISLLVGPNEARNQQERVRLYDIVALIANISKRPGSSRLSARQLRDTHRPGCTHIWSGGFYHSPKRPSLAALGAVSTRWRRRSAAIGHSWDVSATTTTAAAARSAALCLYFSQWTVVGNHQQRHRLQLRLQAHLVIDDAMPFAGRHMSRCSVHRHYC